jgi:hypothetical protein
VGEDVIYYFKAMSDMSHSDLITLAAVFVAILSALYARQARDAAQRANGIALHNNLRPLRLAAYQSMREFTQFCTTYRTLWQPEPVHGTRNLVEHIETFKWEIDRLGPLAMPDVEKKAVELQNMAGQLQRVLDRLAAGQNKPADQSYDTAEHNLDGLVDWFANEHLGLKALFLPYLDNA